MLSGSTMCSCRATFVLQGLLLLLCFLYASAGSLWPQPAVQSYSDRVLFLAPQKFSLTSLGHDSNTLDEALTRYEALIFDSPSYTDQQGEPLRHLEHLDGAIESLNVYVASSDQSLNLETDESYQLALQAPESWLNATTVYGALRGLETFVQLVDRIDVPTQHAPGRAGTQHAAVARRKLHAGSQGRAGGRLAASSAPVPAAGRHHHEELVRVYVVNATIIHDRPRFRHRGLLVDSSRHFLPLHVIKDHLDAMAASKMNVLHWHMVDDQSFPYESSTYPLLHQMGAYSSHHTYTQGDVQDIISYARARGIRVVPEFDTPGHMQSWGKAYPELLTTCYDEEGQPTQRKGPINPIPKRTYAFMWGLLQELARVFPDAYLHMGGDEVWFDCWQSNPEIQAYMKEKSLESFSELEEMYISRVLDLAARAGRSYVVWQEVFDNNMTVKNDTIFHVWKWWWPVDEAGPPHLQARQRGSSSSRVQQQKVQCQRGERCPAGNSQQLASRHGTGDDPPAPYAPELQRITAQGYRVLLSAPWYLDQGRYGGEEWPAYYTVEPQGFEGSQEQHDLVVGGEACMWGEYTDATNAVSKVWPYAAVVGERLWSPKDVRSVDEARPRLVEHRCRLLARGLLAEPVGPGYCPTDFTL